MFLIIHNLPAEIRTADIKALILAKCGLEEVILDNLVNEGRNKKVTVALADESDAAILVRKINGLFVSGQQLYVENVKLSKASEQPYRSTKTFLQKPPKEVYADPETRSFVNPGYEQDSPSLLFNNGNQAVFNPSQGLYNPNGQVLWDQAAMMMNYNMGVGAMGVGGMMYVPPVGTATPFMDYSGQIQTGLSRQGVAPLRGQHEEEKREWADRARQPLLDDQNDHERPKWDIPDRPARISRWEESNMMSRTEPLRRCESPKQRDVWPQERLESRDVPYGRTLYDPEDSFLNTREPVGRQVGRDALRRGSEVCDTARQGPSDPWDKSNSFTSRNFEERQIATTRDIMKESFVKPTSYKPTRDLMNDRFDNPAPYKPPRNPMNERFDNLAPYKPPRNPMNDRFDNPAPYKAPRNPMNERFDNPAPYKPWQQKSAGGAPPRPTRFDKPPAEERRFVKPGPRDGPRFSQNVSDPTNNWRGPRDDPKGLPFPRNQKPGGGNKRPLLSETRDNFASKPNPARRDRDEPPTKRFAGPPKSNTLNVNKPGAIKAGPAGKDGQPIPLAKLVQRDETWRGQATGQVARLIAATLGLVLLPKQPVLQALKRSIRARIDDLMGKKRGNTMEDYVKIYRDKYSPATDQEFYDAVMETVQEEEIKKKAAEKSDSKSEAVKTEAAPPGDSVQGKKVATKHVAKKADGTAKKPPASSQAVAQPAAHADRLPKYPGGVDKGTYKSQKRIQQLEMSGDLYELEPAVQKALDEQADTLCDLFMGECEGAANDYEKRVCERISDHVSDEFRKVIRLLVTKRILNIKSSLLIRVYITHGPPPMNELSAFLKQYGALSLRKSQKQKVYILSCDSYDNYDALLQMETALLGTVELKFKPLYLTGPAAKMNRAQVLMQRNKYIQNQVLDTGHFLDKVMWPAKPKNKPVPQDDVPTEAVANDTLVEDSEQEWPETADSQEDWPETADSQQDWSEAVDADADETATADADQETFDIDQIEQQDNGGLNTANEGDNIPDVDNFDEEDLEEW